MGIYSSHIFPCLMDLVLDRPIVAENRRQALRRVDGAVLEIGFGTGLSLAAYPRKIDKLTVVDANPAMSRHARRRMEASPLDVEFKISSTESLPFQDESFDSVVCQWTMCSIRDLPAALHEIKRVLKPSGRLHFFEHGLSPDRMVAQVQKWISPIFTLFAGGCHTDRDIERIIAGNGFHIEELETKYLPGMTKAGGHVFIGVAKKN